MSTPTTANAHHVVVIGAGFGGLESVHRLAGAPVRITLIDRRNHHLFQPILYQPGITVTLYSIPNCSPFGSGPRRRGSRPAGQVELDSKFGGVAVEVDDVTVERDLASELCAVEARTAQLRPQNVLGAGRVLAQSAGELAAPC
jgi:hypothetical protein